ncbi:MAG: helix-turn-helix transcriptional regulator [Ruminococcus sp.]|nr:helix-turn-helix transcriptional regulator [Ruminococcus sp.]
MDQIKIGKFIAETRKGKNITQKQLADKLSISDKTVSKWECGKGLPEVSIMLELCEELNITVNDLLTGEIVSEIDYQNKAEENMMNLMKENQENKKRMILSVICAVITIIATCSLVVIASYIEMPVIVRVGLIIFAVITAATGIGAAAELEVKAGYYECPHCKALFVPTMSEYVKGYHTLTKRRLTCHECGKTSMCKHRIVR